MNGTRSFDTANAEGNDIEAVHNVTNNLDKTGGKETKSSSGTTSITAAKSEGDNADQVQKEAKSNSEPDDENKSEGDGVDQVQKEAKSNSKPDDENKSEGDGADQVQKEAKSNSKPDDENKSEGYGADQVQKEVKSNSKPDDKNKKVDEKLSGPEMCDCSLGYPHSVNLHEESSLKKM